MRTSRRLRPHPEALEPLTLLSVAAVSVGPLPAPAVAAAVAAPGSSGDPAVVDGFYDPSNPEDPSDPGDPDNPLDTNEFLGQLEPDYDAAMAPPLDFQVAIQQPPVVAPTNQQIIDQVNRSRLALNASIDGQIGKVNASIVLLNTMAGVATKNMAILNPNVPNDAWKLQRLETTFSIIQGAINNMNQQLGFLTNYRVQVNAALDQIIKSLRVSSTDGTGPTTTDQTGDV